MATRVESLHKELQASEAALQAYREQEQIVDVTGLKTLPAAEISNLSARLLEVRQTLAAAKIAYLQVTPAAGGENCSAFPPCSPTKACAVPRRPRRLHNRRWPSWRNATGRHILK